MNQDNYLSSQEEINELRHLWFDECWNMSEIAEWFGIPPIVVSKYVHSFCISKTEYLEKKADFAEFLSVFGHRKPLERLAKKRLERLEEAYARS